MTATDGHPAEGELRVLCREDCWELVRSRAVGRFAANRSGSGPLVVPVNYVVTPDRYEIVFRSGAGTKLNASRGAFVTLQVDDVDPLHHTGWSVAVEGHCRWLYEEQDAIEVDTWAPGDRPYVVHLTPTGISGRRIHLTQPDTDGRGYR